MEERFKFQHVYSITGTFVLVVVLMVIAAVVWTGRSQRWFKSNVPLRIVLPEAGAAGIRQGSEVYFLGTRMGTVSDVSVNPAGRMAAHVNIRRDFFLFVRGDSSAVVKRKFGEMGDAYFEITRGHGQPLPEKNASIVCNEQLPSALESAIEEVRRETLLVLKKTSRGLDTWTQLGVDLGETRRHLDQFTIRIETMAAGVEAGKGTVGKWLTDTALADETQKVLTQAGETMRELQGVVTNLNVAVQHVQNGASRLPQIADAVASEARDLPGLVLQTQVSMRELERLIKAMQRHWLLRKYVNQTNPPPVRPPPASESPQQKPVKALRSPKDSAR